MRNKLAVLRHNYSESGDIEMKKNSPDKEYRQQVSKASPGSPLLQNCLKAFLFGGSICLIAEGFFSLYSFFGLDEKTARTAVSLTLITLTAIFTGIGGYDKLAKHAGAGFAVPITGFANSVVSPAIEYSTEGHILGTAVKMFTIAGPVIVYGCSSAVLYGAIYYFFIL